jgi:hypothetical protein
MIRHTTVAYYRAATPYSLLLVLSAKPLTKDKPTEMSSRGGVLFFELIKGIKKLPAVRRRAE